MHARDKDQYFKYFTTIKFERTGFISNCCENQGRLLAKHADGCLNLTNEQIKVE